MNIVRPGIKRELLEIATYHRSVRRKLEPMVITQRDIRSVLWVYKARLATREQIQTLFFTPASRSRCQRRLTLLFRHRYIDKLPGRPVNFPDIYYISRRSTRGLQLIRSILTDEVIEPHRISSKTVQHTLDIASCHIALLRACNASGYSLKGWLKEEELLEPMNDAGILPDAYFQIVRPTDDGPKTSGFFLELERSAKSRETLEERFKRLGDFYYGGRYEAIFGIKALRVLFIVGSDYGLNPEGQIKRLSAICEQLGVTFLRFAPLETISSYEAEQLLFSSIWRQPKEEKLVALF